MALIYMNWENEERFDETLPISDGDGEQSAPGHPLRYE